MIRYKLYREREIYIIIVFKKDMEINIVKFAPKGQPY